MSLAKSGKSASQNESQSIDEEYNDWSVSLK
jgi:hypothetical protein